MPFLDVLVKQKDSNFTTSVHVRALNTSKCLLNGKSECPQRYTKILLSVPTLQYLEQVDDEVQRSTKVLLNNGYNIADINQ
ncbi:hypothetical protein Pmani_013392 [Petrolisthes manimaculis]|uniref:Uncharacterized protein n=1 Tax=Petrolisthes manimaculis TaxID=1843537 RepID=A0AAE1PZ00_9EUCA|nr:hypothetical protein Pmani_013392 [Petrolisthes manimaculis]